MNVMNQAAKMSDAAFITKAPDFLRLSWDQILIKSKCLDKCRQQTPARNGDIRKMIRRIVKNTMSGGGDVAEPVTDTDSDAGLTLSEDQVTF